MNLKETKIFVGGIQGSGKTYLSAHSIIPSFENIFVYAIHPTDFTDIFLDSNQKLKIIIPSKLDMETLNQTCKTIKRKAINGECDLFVIDEADMFLPNNLQTLKKYEHFYDLTINHRHYKKGYPYKDDESIKGLAICYITRRPQSIPTEVVEQCEHLFLFAIEGDNVRDKMESIDADYKQLIPQLQKDKHNFIYKRIGYKPQIYTSCEVQNIKQEDVK